MTQKAAKTLLSPDPEQARKQMEELAATLAPGENAAGEQLRAVAAELVRRGLEVTVIDYQDSQELEAVLPQARHLGPVTVNPDARGEGCQLSWEDWVDIGDDARAGRAADMVATLLNSIAPQAGADRAGVLMPPPMTGQGIE
jgi:hypothetical protein